MADEINELRGELAEKQLLLDAARLEIHRLFAVVRGQAVQIAALRRQCEAYEKRLNVNQETEQPTSVGGFKVIGG